MPCMTHVISFYYGKSHINGPKKLGTMMLCMTYVISFYFGKNTSSCIVLRHLALSCIILHCLASSCIVLHHLALSCIVLHHLASSCIILHCLPSSCIALHCLAFLCHISHRSTTPQTNIGMITMQFSGSHGQPLRKPREMQQMLKIFVCQSPIFYKHSAYI